MYSSGEAIQAIKEVAAETLPQGYGFEFSGMTREESSTGTSTTALIFVLCLVFVYLLLSAQYESQGEVGALGRAREVVLLLLGTTP